MNIIDSKLKIPNSNLNLTRHRLFSELDNHPNFSLFLVTGNSGYGKTTFVSNYITEKNIPYVWYSLTSTDCYAHVFLSYLKKGILQLENENVTNNIVEPQNVEEELKTIISFFSERPQPTYIVLDNYQLVDKSPEIQSIMNKLLDECSSMVRFIIISQVRPHLHLSKLKMKQRCKELTTFNLAFTIEETRDFFNTMHELELKEHEIKLIHERTEGWIASYQLLLGIIKGLNSEERACLWLSFPGIQDIYDYLSTEVLEAQNQEIKSFLYKTSLLPELDPNVINRFLNIDYSEKILKHLLKHHLFIYQDTQGVIRYHRLFRRFLYQKYNDLLRNEDIRNEHLKLALVYEENYQFVFAFVHLIIGKDYSKAAKLMGTIGKRYNPIESMIFLNGWLEENSFEESMANNTIFLIRCIPLSVLKELTIHFEQNIMLLKKEKNELWLCNLQHRLGTIYLIRGDLTKAKHLFLESLKGSESFHDYSMTALNLNLLAEIYRYLGDYSEAITAIRRALYISDKYGNKHTQLHALDTIASIYLDEGKINEATSYIQQALDIAMNYDHSSLVFVYTTMGRISRLQGNVQKAIEWGEKAVEIARIYNTAFDKGWSYQELGNSYLENRQWAEAEECFSEAYQSFALFTYFQCLLIMSQQSLYQKKGESIKEKEKTNELIQICREHNYHWILKKIKYTNQVMVKEKEDALLQIYTLGNFKVFYRHQLMTIKRKSSLQLLQFLITNRNKKIEKDILIDTLFPEGSFDSIQNQLHVSLSVLRKSIEPNLDSGNQSSFILRSKSHYMFNTHNIDLDVGTFENLTTVNGDHYSNDNIQKMLIAHQLYKGDYFEEYPYTPFLETERENIRLQYFKVCRILAHYYYGQKEYLKSFEFFENILKRDPYQEQIYLEYIYLLLNKNLPAQAKSVAHRMIQYLEIEMGIEVHNRLSELFSQFQIATNLMNK